MPYKKNGFIFIPQIGGHCVEMKIPGIWTFCLHPSTMTEEQFTAVEEFICAHRNDFIRFDELNLNNLGRKSLMGKILSLLYFTRRRIHGLKCDVSIFKWFKQFYNAECTFYNNKDRKPFYFVLLNKLYII